MRAHGVGLVAVLAAACTQVDEEVRLTFPPGTRQLVDALVISVVDPVINDEDFDRARFVPCSELGPFRPVRGLSAGADRPSDPQLVAQERFGFPDDAPEIGFTPPEGTQNPWGAVAVLVEARIRSSVFQVDPPIYSEEESTVLRGCYCIRTREELSDIPELNQAVREACPFVSEDLPGERRDVVMEPVTPPEFRLQPCGTSNAVAPSDGPVLSGPLACLRTQTCLDAPPGEPCFDCRGDCRELEDLRGAVVEFSVLSPDSGLRPSRQLVVTDRSGLAEPSLVAEGCRPGSRVRASLFGATNQGIEFEIDCVQTISSWTLLARAELETFEERIYTSVGFLDGEPRSSIVVQSRSLSRDVSQLTVYELADDQVVEQAEVSFDDVLSSGMVELPAGGGERRAGLVSAWAEPLDGSGPGDSDPQNVQFRVHRWDEGRLVQVGEVIDRTCPHCVCGSQQPCNDSSDCTMDREVCSTQGTCDSESCSCSVLADRDERVPMAVGELDGDGVVDWVAYGGEDTSYVSYLSGLGSAESPFTAEGCSCGRVRPESEAFALVNIGQDQLSSGRPAADLVVAGAQGVFARYAALNSGPQVPRTEIGCGPSRPFGPTFDARLAGGGRFGCPIDASCPELEDAILIGRVRGAARPTQIRVVHGTEPDQLSDPELFVRPERTTLLLPTARRDDASNVTALQTGDVNGDGELDLAVLFRRPEQIRVWLGNGRRGFTEADAVIDLGPSGELLACATLADLVLADLDGDGADEVSVVCAPDRFGSALRIFRGEQ